MVFSTPYVGEDAATRAREWERRFERLPPESGLIFVSVAALPAAGGNSRSFEVRLGISRKLHEATGRALVQHVLADEVASRDFDINVSVYLGSVGSFGRQDPEGPGGHPVRTDERS